MQYVVKGGDTLSSIAQRLGVDWHKITGFRSGNPSLIFPGEVLNIPDLGTSTIAPTTAAPAQAIAQAPASTDWGQKMRDYEEAALKEKQAFFTGTKAEREAKQKELESQYGVGGLRGQLEAIRGQVFNVRDLLNNLERDITERTKGALVSESQKRRQIAAEGEPLRTQLSNLVSGSELASTQLSEALDNISRDMTGFTSDKELQLNALLEKITSGRNILGNEWTLTSTLASEERDFARQKDLLQQNLANSKELAAYQASLDQGTASAGGISSEDMSSLLSGLFGGTTTETEGTTTDYNDQLNKLEQGQTGTTGTTGVYKGSVIKLPSLNWKNIMATLSPGMGAAGTLGGLAYKAAPKVGATLSSLAGKGRDWLKSFASKYNLFG